MSDKTDADRFVERASRRDLDRIENAQRESDKLEEPSAFMQIVTAANKKLAELKL